MKHFFLRSSAVVAILSVLVAPSMVLAKTVSFGAMGQLTNISTRPAQLTLLINTVKPAIFSTLRSAEVMVQLNARTTYYNAKKKKVRVKDIPTYSQVSVEGQYDGKKFVASKVTLVKLDTAIPKGERIMDRIEGAVQTAVSKAKPLKKKK